MSTAHAHHAALGSDPDFISLGNFLKATPHEDGGSRYLFIEASNEDRDHEGEVVLQKALADSADHFLRHGNIDLSHYSMMGPYRDKQSGTVVEGIPNHLEYEIGRPVDVQIGPGRTFVKAELYQGDSPQARNATMVWDSITKQYPPARWYPSVGGAVLAKSERVDRTTGSKFAVIEQVRWANIALDRQPVNKTVPEVSTVPIGVFAKSLGGIVLAKTLVAGYGTDSATLTGGAALRTQSLHGAPITYDAFRDQLAQMILDRQTGVSVADLTHTAQLHFGLSEQEAEGWVMRFMNDLTQRRKP